MRVRRRVWGLYERWFRVIWRLGSGDEKPEMKAAIW